MNVLELLKLIQQIETGKVIKIITETAEQVNELHNTIFSGNIETIKTIGLIIIILMSGIGLMGKAVGDFDLSSILQHVVFTVIIATVFNMSVDVIFKETVVVTSPEKQMTTVQKEVEEEATSKEIESWKQKVLSDIKNHRKNKNAKIPIKKVAVAKEYLTYLKNNENKVNEM